MERHRRVTSFDGLHELRVRSYDDRPVPVQVDGDFIGAHEEAVFSVSPGGAARGRGLRPAS